MTVLVVVYPDTSKKVTVYVELVIINVLPVKLIQINA